MRVYISGPITGVENYKEKFNKAQEYLVEQGFNVINPAKIEFSDLSYEEYMKIDMTLLDLCEGIYMLEGWEGSCGANREYGYALASVKVIMHER